MSLFGELSSKEFIFTFDDNTMIRTCWCHLWSFCSTMAVNLSNIKVRDWFQRQRDSIKPWSEFLYSKKFRPPKSVALGGTRILKNVASFQSNYLFVFLGLLIFCLCVTSLDKNHLH